jgi:hypothetical protein
VTHRKHIMRALLGLALAASTATGEGRTEAPDPTGIWRGTLMFLRQNVILTRGADGRLAGTMASVDQSDRASPMDTVSFEGGKLRFEIKAIGASFVGDLNEAGTEISGLWRQGPQPLPLLLKRAEKPFTRIRPQEPKRPFPFAEEEVEFTNEKAAVTLAGTLTRPKGKGPFPAVLLITGSGPQDRDETVMGHRPFLVLADHLTRRGLAVLRVDDRGVGKSTGNPMTATTRDFAGDALAGVQFLKRRKEIDPNRIGLIGHSEGGVIAPMVAAESRDVAFIVLIAGTGLPGDQIALQQVVDMNRAAGVSAELAERKRALTEQAIGIIRTESDLKKAEQKIRALDFASTFTNQVSAEQLEASVAMTVQMALTPWQRFFLSYDPRPMLRKVTCPVLALNGEKDTHVPAGPNLAAIAQALREGGNADAQTLALPGLNHLLQRCETGALDEYAEIEETMNPDALKAIGDWITQRVGLRAQPVLPDPAWGKA